MLDFTFLPLYLVEVKVNFTKYCRLPGSEWLSFGCYFSYGSEKYFNGMLGTCEGQFIHRLSTGNGGKECRMQFNAKTKTPAQPNSLKFGRAG